MRPINVLGVGSAKGDTDLLILEAIVGKRGSEKAKIFNRIIEPSGVAINRFKSAARAWSESMRDKVEVSFDWVEATFQDYQSGTKHPAKQFHLVHFVGSIYYVEPEDALCFCYENELIDNSVMMVTTVGKESFQATYRERFHDTGLCPFPAGVDHYTSDNVASIAEKNKWRYVHHKLKWQQDITDVFHANREGKLLVDWLTQTIDFENVRGEEMTAAVKEFLAEESELRPDGRRVIDNTYGIVLIYHDSPSLHQ